MKDKNSLRSIANSTIKDEANAISNLQASVDEDFLTSVDRIIHSQGRVIVTGIGKSAIIGQKIVATMNSTGTPAAFMHAADAIHGDLGTIRKEDIVICLSKSGETPEIRILVPLLKEYGSLLIAMVGNRESFLARHADLIIDTTVPKEACPNNLAPTSSTTAQLVMGDALAVCLLEARGFTSDDFAKLHPGGALGKQLYLKVGDLYTGNEAPRVQVQDDIRKVIIEISSSRLGATAVLRGENLEGIITDGDLRRMLERNPDYSNLTAGEIMSKNPRTVSPEMLVVNALNLMRKNNITQLLVVENEEYKGVIHLHDILREGII
ncbi:MAG: KpsF/GutQ family sugar-phosphate isomerase [Bacteroidales bacterium]|nr:KpsF/GutQ family sugar-phosphate isomerase [Bacteroidales bacterium]HNW72515.1 KpsF/GutQ family sugar-phosphate isomerase [Bacteroidales bacterium]HPS50877.1 KpsF/GutQ family sugar-phosphate isomerase [Bacteroidales bacterium]